MFVVLIAAVVVVCMCASGMGMPTQVDWNPFDVMGVVDDTASVNLLKSLQVHQYWDVQKGSFRTGILGERLNATHPQFVSPLTAKVSKGGALTTVETLLVDQPALFMHGLSALRGLIDINNRLYEAVTSGELGDCDGESALLNVGGPSLEELQMLRSALQKRLSTFSSAAEDIERSFAVSQRLLRESNVGSTEDYRRAHDELMALTESHLKELVLTTSQRYAALGDAQASADKSMLSIKLDLLYRDHESSITALHRQINVTMEALRYRAAEELKVALQQQQFEEVQLLATKSELLQAEVEQVINTFFAEVMHCLQQLTADPAALMTALRYGLMVAVGLLTFLEVVQMLMAVARQLAGASYLPHVRRLDAVTESPSAAERDLSWRPEIANALDQVRASLCAAVTSSLPLPNVLISGPSGSGKSAAVRSLIQQVGLASRGQRQRSYVLEVCGADLQALGDGAATQFLNDLIRSASSRPGPLLLVVDDADAIVMARGKGEGHRKASGCLFALLTGLRENSVRVGMVLATRLDVSDVDESVLDRWVQRCGTSWWLYSPCDYFSGSGWMRAWSCPCLTTPSASTVPWPRCTAWAGKWRTSRLNGLYWMNLSAWVPPVQWTE
jgi:hypothetical protein